MRLNAHADKPLQVWEGNRLVASGLQKRFHPWGLAVADVDGHGPAIAVGVTKSTHNLRFPHRTLFLFRIDGTTLVPRWTGSTMGRPLLEFCFSPQVPQRLFTLETRLDGRTALSGYRWSGFGFRKIGIERTWLHAEQLISSTGRLTLKAEGHQVSFNWSEVLQ